MASKIRDIHLSRNAMLAVVTVIGIVAIGLLVYFLVNPGGHEKPKKDQTNQQALQPPSRPAPLQPGEHARNVDQGPTYPSPGPGQTTAVIDAARSFTDAWLRTDRNKAAWLAGIEPYGTQAFNRQRELNDPSSVPASSRSGEPRETSSGSGFSIVTVPLNSGTLTLEFRYVDKKWLIASYSFDLRAP